MFIKLVYPTATFTRDGRVWVATKTGLVELKVIKGGNDVKETTGLISQD